MKVFLLTRAINEYDQDGEYFVNVFRDKPTKKQLTKNGVKLISLDHVFNGGGRTEKMENEWFFLREIEI